MMKHEFEALAGYEVTYEDYSKIIEPMYMAIPESISKQEFVKIDGWCADGLPEPVR